MDACIYVTFREEIVKSGNIDAIIASYATRAEESGFLFATRRESDQTQ